MLLARLQRQPERRPAPSIFRNANEAARDMPFESLPRGEVGGMGASVTKWHAKTLGTPNRHIRPEFARRPQQGQAEQIRSDSHESACRVRLLHKTGIIVEFAIRVGILHQGAEDLIIKVKCLVIGDDDLNSHRPGARSYHVDSLWMAFR